MFGLSFNLGIKKGILNNLQLFVGPMQKCQRNSFVFENNSSCTDTFAKYHKANIKEKKIYLTVLVLCWHTEKDIV